MEPLYIHEFAIHGKAANNLLSRLFFEKFPVVHLRAFVCFHINCVDGKQ